MAKRKPNPEVRRARVVARQDAELLRQYAHHCYQAARAEQSAELALPIWAIVPVEGKSHRDILGKTRTAIVVWFDAMKPHEKRRARAKIRREMGMTPGYTEPSAEPRPLTFDDVREATDAINESCIVSPEEHRRQLERHKAALDLANKLAPRK